MPYKTQEEIEAALAVPYDGPTKEKNGFTYIPARESIKVMNEIFGPLGWSDEIVAIEEHPVEGIYVAAGKITAHFIASDGTERVVTRGDVGRSTADATFKEKEAGHTSVVSGQLIVHDRAAAAAATDYFSRASKKFGPALGSFLYDKESTTSTASGRQDTVTGPATNATGGKGPSPKQAKILLDQCGYTQEMLTTTPFQKWKADLDAHFANRANSF